MKGDEPRSEVDLGTRERLVDPGRILREEPNYLIILMRRAVKSQAFLRAHSPDTQKAYSKELQTVQVRSLEGHLEGKGRQKMFESS